FSALPQLSAQPATAAPLGQSNASPETLSQANSSSSDGAEGKDTPSVGVALERATGLDMSSGKMSAAISGRDDAPSVAADSDGADNANAAPSQSADIEPDKAPSANLDGLEDKAAALLRPMVKEWLEENMPRVIEKALRMEQFAPTDGGHAAPSVSAQSDVAGEQNTPLSDGEDAVASHSDGKTVQH
ncbi:MAG: DUF2497 domain-containing protein, partial [Pseudomonadota bacterium]